MRTGGDKEGGFELERDEPASVLKLRLWGFWSVEVARRFGDAILEEARAPKKMKTLVIDASELKPQRDVGQTAIGGMLDSLTKSGVARVSILTTSPLTKLQLVRIAKERAPKGVVEFQQVSSVA